LNFEKAKVWRVVYKKASGIKNDVFFMVLNINRYFVFWLVFSEILFDFCVPERLKVGHKNGFAFASWI
jgi:hypothetical protein